MPQGDCKNAAYLKKSNEFGLVDLKIQARGLPGFYPIDFRARKQPAASKHPDNSKMTFSKKII